MVPEHAGQLVTSESPGKLNKSTNSWIPLQEAGCIRCVLGSWNPHYHFFCTFIHHHYEGDIQNTLLFHSSLKMLLFYGLEFLVSHYS